MRINKYLASCGAASRRSCDALIKDGRVTINGKPAQIGSDVGPSDVVLVDGKSVSPKKNEYYMLNKPKGCICSVRDEKGRKTVLDFFPDTVGNIFPVGRLDYDSEGMLILTTDGELADRLMRPTNNIPRTYVAKIEGTINEASLNPIRSGIEIDGRLTKKCRAHIIETNREYTKVELVLTEGKNHEVRKMFEAIGHEVLMLRRTKIGDLTLRGLDRGKWRKLSQDEVYYLMSL